ncbi:MAG: hypothetical protein OXG24_09145 [Gammaproteobacteria bacterium]|nr:hypothetical protein [Gammaproteobacteria bacterium]
MASVVVRNIDDDVVASLKDQAKANHRSLEGEIRNMLTEHVRRSTNIEAFRTFAATISTQTMSTKQTDSVDLIRQDRDR